MENADMGYDSRILINAGDEGEAADILDASGIRYDYDNKDRLMVDSDDIETIDELFEAKGIGWDLI